MANETATKSKRFYCVSLIPDICKTPIGSSTPPIPYSVVGEFADATDVSPNVKSRSEPVILHNRSVIPTVKGDERGTAGGIKSGTHGKRVETKTASKTYFSNGKATVQEGCEVWMNNRNTIGKIYERGGIAPRTRLQQISAMLEEQITEATDDTRAALKSAAKDYQDNVSGAMHQFGADAIDKGGKVALGSAALGGAGLAAAATGVGAPVGAVMSAGAVAGGAVGGAVSGVGMAAESLASVLDHAVDYIMTGKTPDLLPAAQAAVERAGLGLLGAFGPMAGLAVKKFPWLGKIFKNKDGPGKRSNGPPPSPPRPPDKPVGGKTSKKKQEKSDKPSSCCPKNAAPGGKPVSSRHPVHFGTGEEVLYQTDVVLDGPIALEWTRCYRSGSELEDWGMCGARWATPFTASLALVGKGIVYVDDSGRAIRLPALAVGASFDSRKEGLTLARNSATEFILTWRDGSTDTFVRDPAADGWLPHGYDSLNAMRPAGSPVQAERYPLRRSAGRNGRGIDIERFSEAKAGELLLRVRSDDGQVLEAMRDDGKPSRAIAPGASSPIQEPPRIGRIEEVCADGTRVCHAVYQYEAEAAGASRDDDVAHLSVRHNLVRQTNLVGDARTYGYLHHLLTAYTTYTGFAHTLEWISLAALRERWRGSPLSDADLMERFPLTVANSYQARAIATNTGDGLDGVRIAYLDEDTTRVTDANGGGLDYTFDANWLAVDVRRLSAGGATSLGRRVWDSDGMLLAEIDAGGRATRYAYDAAGNLTVSTDALGQSGRIDYDAHNQPVAITDPLSHVTRLDYDQAGNLSARTDALGHVTGYRYDDQGRLVALLDAKGGTKQLRYDRAGRLSSYTDCSGYRTTYEYDAAGRLACVTDAQKQATRYDYDRLGRLDSVTQADGTQEQFAYDADNRLHTHRDAAGQQTQYRYNGHGLPVTRIDAIGQTLQYRYDPLLQLIELINGNGESYHFAYDAEGRLRSETGFDGKTTTYSYDDAGHLVASECAGQRTELLRDVLGQLLAKYTADGVHRYAYDALGRLTAVAAPHAQQRFAYDPLGQLLEERSAYYLSHAPGAVSDTGDGADAGFVMSHAYDELGNRTQTVLPNGRRIDILRYGSGHWHGTLWQGNTIVAIERDKLHRETLRRIGPAQTVSAMREYDPQSRISRMTLRRSSDEADHPLRDRRFKYDAVGNLLEIKHGWHTSNDTLGTFSYRYDPLGQLLSAVQPGLTETFAFDPAGNLLDVPPPATSDMYPWQAPAPAVTLAPVTHNLLKAYQGHRYTYDDQGNVTNKHYEGAGQDPTIRDLDLTYDAENRLIRAVRTQAKIRHTARYFYDAFSRRIAKHVVEEKWNNDQDRDSDAPESRSSQAKLFVWDGDALAQELGPDKTVTYLYEPDGFVPLALIESVSGYGTGKDFLGAGTGQPNRTKGAVVHLREVKQWTIQLSHDDDTTNRTEAETTAEATHTAARTQGIEEANTISSHDEVYFYSCDHLGTPRELVDEVGRVVWSRRYRAWGQAVADSPWDRTSGASVSGIRQQLRFQGQYEDDETGLHYNRHRSYDPDTARFISQDPIGLLGGPNSYAYSPNPTAWVDPLGLARNCPRTPSCDPCDGKNPSAEARKWQGSAPYKGVDRYRNTALQKDTTIYALYHPGQGDDIPSYFVDGKTLASAGWDHKKLHDLLQVKSALTDPTARSPRTLVRMYTLTNSICVARGRATRNGKFGSGGGLQMFIPESEKGSLMQNTIIGLRR